MKTKTTRPVTTVTLTAKEVGEALGPVEDPEIHISIVELGLIYGAEITDSKEGKSITPAASFVSQSMAS